MAYRALSLDGERRRFIVCASVLACIAGSMGCALAGLGGLAGMALGLAMPTAPALFFQREA